MKFTFSDIKSIFENCEYRIQGNIEDIIFDSISSLDSTSVDSIDWCTYKDLNMVQKYVDNSSSKIIILDLCMYNLVHTSKILIFVPYPKFIISKILNLLFSKKDSTLNHSNYFDNRQFEKIANNVYIGKNCIIGDVIIGENTIIYGNSYIFDNVVIGKNVIIYPGVIIGAPGFGFIEDNQGNLVRFTHVGKVIINDNVEIGSNTVIDRGAIGDTIIGTNTKIDSMVHIGHNVKIGKQCMICSNTTICGSAKIGDNVWISPNSVIKDHVTIVDNTFIGLGSVVVNSILKPKKVFGNPAKELRF